MVNCRMLWQAPSQELNASALLHHQKTSCCLSPFAFGHAFTPLCTGMLSLSVCLFLICLARARKLWVTWHWWEHTLSTAVGQLMVTAPLRCRTASAPPLGRRTDWSASPQLLPPLSVRVHSLPAAVLRGSSCRVTCFSLPFDPLHIFFTSLF